MVIPSVGQQFGAWQVTEESAHPKPGGILIRCRCSCGIVRDVRLAALTSGRSTSCGGTAHRAAHRIVGGRYGRWLVESVDPDNSHNVIATCECGTRKSVDYNAIVKGKSESCGCLRKEVLAVVRATHGHSRTTGRHPLYHIWGNLIGRCHNPRNAAYKWYGGRGITVCDRWRNSFENFLADVGPRPSPKHSLDRYPDMNGNYEPGNVRWATWREQQNNRTSNIRIEFNGRTLTLEEWSRETGVSSGALRYRIKNWGVERALTEPASTVRHRKRG